MDSDDINHTSYTKNLVSNSKSAQIRAYKSNKINIFRSQARSTLEDGDNTAIAKSMS